MKITNVTSELFEWDRPGIWNGSHFYGKGRLHKVTVCTDEGITGYGWNGGTAAERPLNLFPGYVDYFRPMLVGRDPRATRSLTNDLGEKQIKITIRSTTRLQCHHEFRTGTTLRCLHRCDNFLGIRFSAHGHTLMICLNFLTDRKWLNI